MSNYKKLYDEKIVKSLKDEFKYSSVMHKSQNFHRQSSSIPYPSSRISGAHKRFGSQVWISYVCSSEMAVSETLISETTVS